MSRRQIRQSQRTHGSCRLLQRSVCQRILEEIRILSRLEKIHLYTVPRLRKIHPVAIQKTERSQLVHSETLLCTCMSQLRTGGSRCIRNRYLQRWKRRNPGVHTSQIQMRRSLFDCGNTQARNRIRSGLFLGKPRS